MDSNIQENFINKESKETLIVQLVAIGITVAMIVVIYYIVNITKSNGNSSFPPGVTQEQAESSNLREGVDKRFFFLSKSAAAPDTQNIDLTHENKCGTFS